MFQQAEEQQRKFEEAVLANTHKMMQRLESLSEAHLEEMQRKKNKKRKRERSAKGSKREKSAKKGSR